MTTRSLWLLLLLAAGAHADGHETLTLEKIMADPDWIGNAPEAAYWGDDSATVFFNQKRVGEIIRDPFKVDVTTAEISPVDADEGTNGSGSRRVYNADRSAVVWSSAGDVFMRRTPDGRVQQLTRTVAAETDAMFLGNGGVVAYQRDGQFYRHDPLTGEVAQLADIRFEDDPLKAEKFDGLREHQRRLYTSVFEDSRRREANAAANKARQAENPDAAPLPIYLGKKFQRVGQVLSPDGKRLLVVTRPAGVKFGKRGVMPNYMTESGYTETRSLRPRVGRNVPVGHRVWSVNLAAGTLTEIDFSDLDGIDEDPLAKLRKSALEWHTERGADEDVIKKQLKAPEQRTLQVEEALWSADGAAVALQLHSVDNKDRWIVTIDSNDEVQLQHRLTDEAWVNYAHNDMGWLADSSGLWFLSEQSGYSQLFVKSLSGRREVALTDGDFVVSAPVLSPDGSQLYFVANVKHPSTYEIHRVPVAGGDIETLTELGGVNAFSLSPDGDALLVMHSEFDRHVDLFVVPVGEPAAAKQLTDTVSAEFKSIDWVIPKIVEIPSTHVDRDIYSKLYLPADYDATQKYPVVMFVHGAGYTQNAHAGWPYYFREFMFHTLLTHQDVIVIDMDFRASKGYGRDWRTAIYRNMGRPEIEDFQDGINWLAENYSIDQEKMGVYGGSYGGFMTFMAMFLAPDLFAAGAALRPVSDWAHYNHGYTSNILNTPMLDPVAYERSSPIVYADGLQNPLLIAAGMQDDNVFFQDSVLMVQRFLELQKEDFEIALYPLDPHGFTHADSWLDEYRRIYKLFDRHVF
ncbi:MAG: prolyl oligopeptidase family serine peptidase [Woeseiaceae bacterium]